MTRPGVAQWLGECTDASGLTWVVLRTGDTKVLFFSASVDGVLTGHNRLVPKAALPRKVAAGLNKGWSFRYGEGAVKLGIPAFRVSNLGSIVG